MANTINYFVPRPATLDELKTSYRRLAMQHHPDRGGNAETMKALNNEYDMLFPVYQAIYNRTAGTPNVETANSTRSEFYTENGWKGENYSRSLTLKETACIIREYCKDVYNDFRFSVTTEYFAGGCALTVALMEAPTSIFTVDSEQKGHLQSIETYCKRDRYRDQDVFLTDEAAKVIADVNKFVESFRFSDCDGMIDYFNVNFWFHFDLGKWNKPYKIVPRERTAPAYVEYETVEVIKTRSYETLEPRELPMPAEFQPGQRFILKNSFNYGCFKGYVYEISRADGWISAYKMDKKLQKVCTGDGRGNKFSGMEDKFRKWVEQGSIAFVELVKVTKTEEYTSVVRRPKKHAKASAVSTEVKSGDALDTNTDTEPKEYTITPEIDTRDNSSLWVLRITRKLDTDEYRVVADKLKAVKGYYSKFKHGFIFRYNPAEAVKDIIA